MAEPLTDGRELSVTSIIRHLAKREPEAAKVWRADRDHWKTQAENWQMKHEASQEAMGEVLQENTRNSDGQVEALAAAFEEKARADALRDALREIVNLCDVDAEFTGRAECKVAEHAMARAALSKQEGCHGGP